MANVYYKILNKNIRMKYTESIISGLQKELFESAKVLNEDLFDVSRGIGAKRKGLDVDCLLKYYILNQILKNMPEVEEEVTVRKNYAKTANKNYRKDPDKDEYYQFKNNEWVLAEDIVKVNDDGSYLKDEKNNNSSYIFRKLYSIDNTLISVQVISPDGHVVNSKTQVIELMNLRQEFVLRYKHSGYSGNSNDIIASILNQFTAPIETGLYMDRYYNLFKWNERQRCFEKYDETNQSPLLIDYDFGQNRKVIKKEYTGIK